MNHIVSGCKDCCFYFLADLGYIENRCSHPLHITKTIQDIEVDLKEVPITPDWCPLKKENTTIVFDDKEEVTNNQGIWAVENTDSQIAEDIEYLPPLSKLTEVFIKDNENKTK